MEKPTGGEEVMRRRKRNTILRIALGLAIAAIVPATALAKPVPVNQDVEDHGQYQLGPGEIPYSVPVNQDVQDHGQYQLGPGEVPYYSGATVQKQAMELGLSEGKINALGLGTRGQTQDDRSFSKATPVDSTPTLVVSDSDGRSVEFNPYTVTGFVLALLAALGLGMGIAVWHSRRTHLSPA
jgi:hypothetical protein